ncbi:MAG: ABC transporter ATP-binding protein/permease [Ancrocorticia sp.]|jgi:ATP-binding cassette subfamily B multidrug efflux pump|nr:ABC transporter ATP-binding protein/permease [Ancrocorticia sp.]MCI2013184.1 ABC transporter ATP-binding protein/permease [Ancrocorticia sp.]MCI2029894.1 ABC transporter ATP-binding protein/permease [Ancrocorticia sp.]MCI2177887.1 ABC transporter ATP-binding protein/permease [Ancrocorticia sp.]MCI2192901.1 ABC transporter ATP-binding protein/permease [Ancrocorticia sp.]
MKILKFVGKRELALALLALVAIVTQVFFDLRLPDYMQDITKIIVMPGAKVSDVLEQGAYMLGCALGSMAGAVVTAFCMAMIGATLSRNLRAAVFDKTMEFSMEEYNTFGAASLITRSTNDVTQLQMFVVMGLQMAVKSPILAVWAVTKIAGKNFTWTVATGVTVVVLMIMMSIVLSMVMPRMMRMQRITDDLNRVTREHLDGLRVIRAYNAQAFHEKRFEHTNTELTETNMYVMRRFAFMMPAMNAIMSGLSLAIYALGASMINAAGAPADKVRLFSEMIVFSAYAMQVIGAFMMLTMVFIFFPRARVAYRRIKEVLTVPISIQDGPTTSASQHGLVEFRHVNFRYPQADDDALHDVSFTAAPGETVAIIGATGSGKTSIVNLIPRFYDVREGAVLVDGVDVREWKQSDLRNCVAYVPQKAMLFSGTISSNIDYGSGPHAITPEDIVQAARVSASAEIVEQKEDGYASYVAQGGTNFSGGQKQRLSIARAVARGAEIMIFDDSFSALDYRTDRDVRTALRQYARGTTMIIVAQRIGTVRNADRILVVDRGRIVGQGTHDELMKSNEVYREIAFSQLNAEELA